MTDDLPFRDEAPDAAPAIAQTADDPLWSAILGTAGTGKTYLAKEDAEACDDVLLCATTGIAAVNIGSATINSLLWYYDTADLRTQFEVGKLNVALRKIADSGYRRLYVDEVSMMDGHQLDILCLALDQLNEMREAHDEDPLGLTLIGDFAQLPPVNAPFVFERPSWARFVPNLILLTEPRRQADSAFVAALQAVRKGLRAPALEYFAPRLMPYEDGHFNGTTILAKNNEVDRYNALRMLDLNVPEETFASMRSGMQDPSWKHIPPRLTLKAGALVMILANKREKIDGMEAHEWPMIYANGDLGRYLGQDGSAAVIKLHRGPEVTVLPITRERSKATGNKGIKAKREDVLGSITYMPLRVAYASTCHKCVAYGTLIAVQGKGLIPIEYAQIGDWIDTGHPTTPYARLHATTHQEKRLVRITTRRGYTVVCSADHRWKTNRGMQEGHRLIQGQDRVQLIAPTAVTGTQEVAPDVAWWLGVVVGDGNYTDRKEGQIHFTNNDVTLRQGFMRVAQKLGGRPNTRRDERGCHLSNLSLRLRLATWGLDYVTSTSKRIPEAVLRSGRSAWAAFLSGLFDADGGIDRRRLVYCTRSPRLAEEVQLLLLALGIPTTKGSYIISTEGPYKGYEYWHIRVNAESRQQFAAVVGFTHPKKRAELRAYKPNRQIRRFDGWDTVATVHSLDVFAPVIDVELETVHELGLSGIIGSNSQGLSLDSVQVMFHSHFWTQPSMLYVAMSRARTPEGLRLVGNVKQFEQRMVADPRCAQWL